METERISRKLFDSLPDYSMSLPTGVYIGKVWKRHCPDGWVIGEYISHPTLAGRVQIDWRRVEIIEPVGVL